MYGPQQENIVSGWAVKVAKLFWDIEPERGRKEISWLPYTPLIDGSVSRLATKQTQLIFQTFFSFFFSVNMHTVRPVNSSRFSGHQSVVTSHSRSEAASSRIHSHECSLQRYQPKRSLVLTGMRTLCQDGVHTREMQSWNARNENSVTWNRISGAINASKWVIRPFFCHYANESWSVWEIP